MGRSQGSETFSEGFRVRVDPSFLTDQSDPSAGRYVFGYRVMIRNEGKRAGTLTARHWIIVDSDGERQELRGEGVVGRTPRIEPGHSFEYQSFCPLTTEWGTMEGDYTMRTDEGEEFSVTIARFFLVTPRELVAGQAAASEGAE